MGVVEHLLGSVVAPAEPEVDEHHGQPGCDPVADQEQERLVLAAGSDIGLEDQAAGVADDAGQDRQQGSPLAEGHAHLPDAEGDQGHGPAVDVDGVGRDRAHRDTEQGQVVDEVRHRPLQLSGRDVVRPPLGAGHGGHNRAGHLQHHAGDEDAETCPEPDHEAVRRRRQVAGVVGRVWIPAGGVAEGRGEDQDPAADLE